MELKISSHEKIKDCNKKIFDYINSNFELVTTKYVDLGVKTVRFLIYSKEFIPHIEKQLTFGLKDTAESYDATLVLWNEKDILSLAKKFMTFDTKFEMRLRMEKIFRKARNLSLDEQEIYNIVCFNEKFSKTKPIIDIQTVRGFFISNDKERNTYYYGVKNLEPEEFIKEGHLFVQIFNNILKTETSNLAHGAVIGLNGDGILMCARGQRGKSTLSVLSMMKGFEYVSDDYLILHKNNQNELLSSPIYSIITLSPKMYNELYTELNGSQFVSNNARKDKYVFNISNFHDRFRINYPIKICLFPEIVTDKEPSIRPCTAEEKGRAMVQLIQSTLMQTQDLCENWTVKKFMNLVKDFPYYKFHLCRDIEKNTEFLREFMNNLSSQENKVIKSEKIAIDITFDLANILNTETGIIYSMNKFTTNIFENLLNGVCVNDMTSFLKQFEEKNTNILNEFEMFVDALKEKGIIETLINKENIPNINQEFAKEDFYQLSFMEYAEEKYNELIKENKDELCIK